MNCDVSISSTTVVFSGISSGYMTGFISRPVNDFMQRKTLSIISLNLPTLSYNSRHMLIYWAPCPANMKPAGHPFVLRQLNFSMCCIYTQKSVYPASLSFKLSDVVFILRTIFFQMRTSPRRFPERTARLDFRYILAPILISESHASVPPLRPIDDQTLPRKFQHAVACV